MARGRAAALLAAAALLKCFAAAPAAAQAWSIDASVGRAAYEALPRDIAATHLALALRYRTPTLWSYITSAAPLRSEDPYWSAIGAGTRLGAGTAARRLGIDVEGHGYLFRDRILEEDGRGALFEGGPFMTLGFGAADVEARLSYQHHLLDFGGEREDRGVVEALLRAGWGRGSLRIAPEAKLVHASDGTFPWIAASAFWQGESLRAWVTAGRWLADELDDAGWGVGAAYAAGRHELWATVRQEPGEPLFWNLPRRAWLVGVSTRIGAPPSAALAAPRMRAGRVVLRLRAADAGSGAPRIAGEFSDWRPLAMQRTGGYWEVELALPTGIYRYAFVRADGEWFVPASVPGRMDDGMGGHVAVLVVP